MGRAASWVVAGLCLASGCTYRYALETRDVETIQVYDKLAEVPVYLSRRVPPISRRDAGHITNLDDEGERLRLQVCFDDGGCGDDGAFVFEQTDEDAFELRALPGSEQADPGDGPVVLEVRLKQRRETPRF